MPLVRARYTPRFNHQVADLREVCREIVPAAFNSEKGRLTPGSIEFLADPIRSQSQLTVDVLLELEAFHYDDREDMDDRCDYVRRAVEELFPNFSCAVWGKLVTAGWSSPSSDPEFDGDMSMPAALERARAAIGK